LIATVQQGKQKICLRRSVDSSENALHHDGILARNHCMVMNNEGFSRDGWFYGLAALCGIAAGWADVVINDLLFTALLVVMASMLLGILRPRWPWRWVVIVGISIPLTELAAYRLLSVKPTRAQVYGSLLAFFPGIAGAYGGAVVRRVVENLRQGK
jgi:ABC-type multidrug transport system permease subunit